MCLMIPGKVIMVEDECVIVDYISEQRKVKLLENCKPGDYVLVTGGFVVEVIAEDVALKVIETMKEGQNGKC
ncbi:HypC/HybG/HupF family hydrogenase formation chaperone [Candidatus Woesearchaeota archaeon]|jgi:hydrogenase assembly chaperone HypC/HupF|nr:HypC/HybG/HupF family hydrogenase formation chaperone [Candidatus Woesearchaeota archaeon]MBT6520154.1 HypC/HybG/HupF family hydrogenase formation chaperone [Candidatus Woesearchaeota archaeon]MBT7366759.1 HypC/HybG/HupF family hydrogenase formation chaperone [Candidatus Woesearchaeota archaeon]